MVDDRESHFLGYNEREIFKQLISLEEHSRNLDENQSNAEVGCFWKHMASLEGHIDEAISHSAEVAPEKTSFFQELAFDTKSLETIFEKNKNPTTIIPKVRELRKKVEKLDERYNTEKCELCERHPSSPSKSKTFKYSNNDITNTSIEGDETMVMKLIKEMTTPVLGVGAGILLAQPLIDKIGARVSNVPTVAVATLGGIGIAYVAKKFLPGMLKEVGVLAGAFVVGVTLTSYMKGLIPSTGTQTGRIASLPASSLMVRPVGRMLY